MEQLFNPGRIFTTPGALEALKRTNSNPLDFLKRHVTGDWGELCDEDKEANKSALTTGARVMSAYTLPDNIKIWIITEAEIDDEHNRYATTILLPEEY